VQPIPTVVTFGDGVMFDAEPALQDELGTVQPRAFFGSGLTRPEQYDWRVQWPQQLADTGAKAAVILLGVWDARDVTLPATDGTAITYVVGTPEWTQWYTGLVNEALGLFDAAGADVVWLLPMDEPDADKTAKLRRVADVIEQAVAAWPRLSLVEKRDLLRVTIDTQALIGDVGKKLDGQHLCQDGAAVVANAVRNVFTVKYSVSAGDLTNDSWRRDTRYSVAEGCPLP
jgi:hypothetical protein